MTHPQPQDPGPPQQPHGPHPSRWSTARIAAVVTGAVAGVLLVALAIGLGMIFIRTVGTQTPQAAGPAPGRSTAAPRPTFPGIPLPGQEEAIGKIPVVYEVTGTGEAAVTYTVTTGSTVATGQHVTLPWRFALSLDADVFDITLGAVTEGDPPKGFGCAIVVGSERVTDTRPDEVGSVMCTTYPPR
jgi:hypothetical protein